MQIGPPVNSDDVGNLCSLNPISWENQGYIYTVGINIPIPTGVTISGQCRPLGRELLPNRICSDPAAKFFGGLPSPLDTGTCNVISSFAVMSGGTPTIKNICGILPVVFNMVPPPLPVPTPPIPSPIFLSPGVREICKSLLIDPN